MKLSSLRSPETKFAAGDTTIVAPTLIKKPSGAPALRWELWRRTRTRLKDTVKMFITERFKGCHGQLNESRIFARLAASPQARFTFPKYPLPGEYFLQKSGFVRYPVVAPAGADQFPADANSRISGRRDCTWHHTWEASSQAKENFFRNFVLLNRIAASIPERFLAAVSAWTRPTKGRYLNE